MPIYEFKNKATGEITERLMSIASMEQFLVDNPEEGIHISSAPAIGDTVRLGLKKTPESFRQLLKHIKKGNRSSTINDS